MGLRILVSGKGGSGKTTIAALTALIFAKRGYSVLVLDTDSVPNVAQSLGVPLEVASKIIPLVKNEELVAEKTGARPGEGWGLLFSLTPDVSDIVDRYGVKVRDNIRLVVVGSIDASKEGCLCPAIALAKAFLLHVLLKKRDIVIIDSEAGAEVFGRGLAEKFDVNLCVTEPTLKSLTIAKKLVELGKQLGIKHSIVVLNKVVEPLQAVELFSKTFSNDVPYHIVRYSPKIPQLENLGVGLDKLEESDNAYRDVEKLVNYLEKLV